MTSANYLFLLQVQKVNLPEMIESKTKRCQQVNDGSQDH